MTSHSLTMHDWIIKVRKFNSIPLHSLIGFTGNIPRHDISPSINCSEPIIICFGGGVSNNGDFDESNDILRIYHSFIHSLLRNGNSKRCLIEKKSHNERWPWNIAGWKTNHPWKLILTMISTEHPARAAASASMVAVTLASALPINPFGLSGWSSGKLSPLKTLFNSLLASKLSTVGQVLIK